MVKRSFHIALCLALLFAWTVPAYAGCPSRSDGSDTAADVGIVLGVVVAAFAIWAFGSWLFGATGRSAKKPEKADKKITVAKNSQNKLPTVAYQF